MQNRTKIYLGVICLLFLFIISDNKLKNVIAVDNYSNYLYNEGISVYHDRALIKQHDADDSNGYRNELETNFLFPSKLRDDMFSIFPTTNYAKYYFSQYYLSHLNDDKTFKSLEVLSDYNSESYPNTSDFSYDKGFYASSTNESVILLPNGQTTDEWDNSPSPQTYMDIDEYPNYNDADYMLGDYGEVEILTFTDLTALQQLYTIDFVEVSIRHTLWSGSGMTIPNYLSISTNGTYNYVKYFNSPLYSWQNSKFIFYNVFSNNFNSLTLKIIAGSGGGDVKISQIYISLNASRNILYNSINGYYSNSFDELSYSEGTGNFLGNYSFLYDTVGQNPLWWTTLEPTGTAVNVIQTKEAHNKVVELSDDSASNEASISNDIIDKTYGTVEFWMLTTSTTMRTYFYLYDSTNQIMFIRFYINGYISTSESSDLVAYTANTWYHIRIDFECRLATAYQDLVQYHYHVYINDVHYGDYSFTNNYPHLSKITYKTWTTSTGYDSYIDAVDFSWCDFYYFGRNYQTSTEVLNCSVAFKFNEPNESNHILNSLKINYSYKTNCSVVVYFYIFDFIAQDYVLLNNTIITSFSDMNYSVPLDYKQFTKLRDVKFKFYVVHYINFTLSIEKLKVIANYQDLEINDEGYLELNTMFHRKNTSNVYRGNYSIQFRFYKTYYAYRYLETNQYDFDYYTNWININYQVENLTELEINLHCRYGLNTLEIDISNIKIEIFENYNATDIYYFQSQYDLTSNSKYAYSFNYSCYNMNRFNLTGVFGNYSYNNLNGFRLLRGTDSINYNRFFTVPYYNEAILLKRPTVEYSESGGGLEPIYPSAYFWSYTTYRLTYWKTESITIGNWSADFYYVKAEAYSAKFPYEPKTYENEQFGSWTFKIKFSEDWSYTVSFNFLRNAICWIINLLLLILQYIGFLAQASISLVSMFIFTGIMAFVWNYPVYYLWSALVWVLWYVFAGLALILGAIWQGLVWVYENLLIPFLDWFFNTGFPLLVDCFIIVWAFLITCLIWAMSLGQVDFAETYDAVYNMLWTIADFVWLNIILIVENLPALFIALGLYLLLIGMTYVTYVYCKSRGFKERAEALYDSLMTYLLPITLTYQIIKKIYDAIPTAG